MQQTRYTMRYSIDPAQAVYWRNQLVAARDAAFRDAERFYELLFTIEKLGQFLNGKVGTLASYKRAIGDLASRSWLAYEIPNSCRCWHTPFDDLYELVRVARNEALHQGAYARHLTDHAVRLSLILEDALMAGRQTASDFMVRDPVVIYGWQPVSFAREQMLTHGFSFLPIMVSEGGVSEWCLLSEYAVTKYLRLSKDPVERKNRLATRIQEAVSTKDLELVPAPMCLPDTPVEDVVSMLDGKPVLVVEQSKLDTLIGIITAFDLM